MPESRIDAFMMRMLKSLKPSTRAAGQTIVVVHQPFISVIPDLLKVFKGNRDVQVIADRRSAESRTKEEPVSLDSRRTERRERKAELLEVVFRD
jgi:hypothetical protein